MNNRMNTNGSERNQEKQVEFTKFIKPVKAYYKA